MNCSVHVLEKAPASLFAGALAILRDGCYYFVSGRCGAGAL